MATVAELYQQVLGRAPDPAGLEYWTSVANSGQDITAAFNQAAQAELANPAPETVQQWYGNTLGREADTAGLNYWDNYTNGNAYEAFKAAAAKELPKQTNTMSRAEAEAAVQRIYGNVLGRSPDAGGLTYYTNLLMNGTPIENITQDMFTSEESRKSALAKSAQDAARYGVDENTPIYGTEIGGQTLATAPDLASLEQAQRYGQTVAGYEPAKYGEDVRGLGMVDYARDVQTPMDQWQYEQSPAYQAKSQLMAQQVGNQLAARGIRGATPVNIMADQNRKLIAEDYGNERNFEFQNMLQKYQAQGLEYDKAYQAASQEYGAALTSQNQGAAQAQQNALTQYQMNLAQYQDMYNKRSQEAASAYDKIINEIKIGQNAAGSVASAGTNLANQTSNALNVAGTAASNAALQSGIAAGSLYSGLGNVGANLFGNTSAQKTLGSNTTGLGTTLSSLVGSLGA